MWQRGQELIGKDAASHFPLERIATSIGTVARPLPSFWVKGGVAGGDENQGARTRHKTRRPPFYDCFAISPSRLGKPLLCRGLSFVL